ncbi:hypothetical protein [Nitrosopumilus sp.]|uniref:hypothetical protein n=1 Tax=Nitrosopumilus sp. TaxID=2024843 RepID=UPI00247BABA7|nr:hypothetical protein [Nitrosopumilus sp.]MCV0431411.1 hypothetical protein [Nitrosopumilus sp.]
MEEIFVYCKTCQKKVKAMILTKHEKEYDKTTGSYKRLGIVRILQHTIGFRKNCEDTSQIKAIVESETKDSNGVMI